MPYAPQLDGLRGVAIVLVMLYHARVPGFGGGFIGVDIFFVLSGFLITSLLIQEHRAHGMVSLRNFYIRRVLRLMPALLSLLLVFCVVSHFLYDGARANSNFREAIIALFYFTNWTRAYSLQPPGGLLGHTWSLSIEEQFYLLWPVILICILGRLKGVKHALAFALGMALASWAVRLALFQSGASPDRIYNGLDTHADGLMLGCALGVVRASSVEFRFRAERLGGLLGPAAVISALVLMGFVYTARTSDEFMIIVGYIAVALCSTVLLAELIQNPGGILATAMKSRLLVWIGSISYGLYLWHYPIFRALQALGFEPLVVATAGTSAALLAATLSYHLIERPVLRLKRHFVLDRAVPAHDGRGAVAP